MKKKAFIFALASAAAASLQVQGAVVAADTFGDYTVGNNLGTPLSGGTGWNGNWIAGTSGGTLTASGVVSTTTPLAGGGNYLDTSLASSTAGASLGIGREIAGGAPTGSFTVSFDWRVDSFGSFTTSNDRFEIFMPYQASSIYAASTNNTATEHSPFLIGVFGVNRGSSTAGSFAVYNPAVSGSTFDANNYFNLGVAGTSAGGGTLNVVAGTTYSFTINVDTDTDTWNVSVSNGTNTYFSNGLHTWGTDANGFMAFGGRGDAANEVREFSFDNVQVIPEPGSVALLTLSAAAPLLRRRRR